MDLEFDLSGVRQKAARPRRFSLWRLVGMALLVFAIFSAARTINLIRHGTLTEGTVVGINQESGDRPGAYSYWPVIEFRTADGRLTTFAHDVGFRESPTDLIGKTVEVTYQKSDPTSAIWGSPSWAGSLVLGISGLLLAGLIRPLLRLLGSGKALLTRDRAR